ncbi:MAG: hypothetical protein KTR14_01275 [Vampirovibrio sp.]|nr:hypothetical protein [Vampirovibrio sp.]
MSMVSPIGNNIAGFPQSPNQPPQRVAGGLDENGERLVQISAIHAEGCGFCASIRDGLMTESQLAKLKQDSLAEVMAHEQAHQSAAGAYAGAIHIDFDANGIAIGGHVPITFPPLTEDNPEIALKGAEMIRAAALAPSDPSGQDMSVASQAMDLLGRAKVMMDKKRKRQELGAGQA